MARTALVTGANRGIGAAIARALAAQGMTVVLGVRNPDNAETVVADIRHDGGTCETLNMNVADPASVDAALASLEPRGTQVDILINNAAILEGERLLYIDIDAVMESVRTNAVGPLQLIQKLAPKMAQRGYGRIVNLSSQWGSLTSLGPGAYGITKAMLNAITVKTAGEAGRGVKINAMCPGWVNTRMGGSSAPREPEQAAETAVFLATLPDDGPTGAYFRDCTRIGWDD
ncbi:SDR family NAD(P)-dependent oxidoreductase [Tepidamorphus sp. 3E244]|uniref:SDR family NAD(P)-dependent oxidoreductase n=1 Tax=Tepidamorphus sp. 3E244 TaxID=3385498 RepID=UPI0038FCFE21